MELAFDSEGLRSLCEDESVATRELGAVASDLLRHRLADLRAASSIADLLVGRPRMVVSAEIEQLVIDLNNGFVIVLQANHPKNPIKEGEGLDWEAISRLKVVHIGRDDESK